MQADIAIRVEHAGKAYQVFDRPSQRLRQLFAPAGRAHYRAFHALSDVSFEVARGEAVGIIGRNGSGKSTLLQVICGLLTPTSGRIESHGRVAALLELGTGFNPEFTGRENVFLNAQLLGLSTAEIENRFDAIAAFADIGEFIEQPVKTYSSGMFVRLAFATVAHVDADILVIDEALSVGDAAFSQKCMRFIRAFRERGTLLFVSHDMGAVQSLCNRAVWMERGRVRQIGSARQVAEDYLRETLKEIYGNEVSLSAVAPAPADPPAAQAAHGPADYGARAVTHDHLLAARGFETGHARIESVSLRRAGAAADGPCAGGETVTMRIGARAIEPLASAIIGFAVRDRLGQDLFGENTLPFTDAGGALAVPAGAAFTAEFTFRLPMLPNGTYFVMTSVADGDLHHHTQHHWLHDAMVIEVFSSRVRFGLTGIAFERVELRLEAPA